MLLSNIIFLVLVIDFNYVNGCKSFGTVFFCAASTEFRQNLIRTSWKTNVAVMAYSIRYLD